MGDSGGLSFGHISYVTLESVLEVVIVAFAGFWCAYTGLLPKQGQKVISKLNVDLFTPCLIFSKLARSLSLAKILEIAVIPVFYALTTGVSFLSGKLAYESDFGTGQRRNQLCGGKLNLWKQ